MDVFRSSGHATSSQAQGNSVVGRECLLLGHVLFRGLESIHPPVFFWPFFGNRLNPSSPDKASRTTIVLVGVMRRQRFVVRKMVTDSSLCAEPIWNVDWG